MGMMSEMDMDRQRLAAFGADHNQLYAVAKLVGYCEAIASSGLVGEIMEQRLRERIAETLSVFNMEPHQASVKREMAR